MIRKGGLPVKETHQKKKKIIILSRGKRVINCK